MFSVHLRQILSLLLSVCIFHAPLQVIASETPEINSPLDKVYSDELPAIEIETVSRGPEDIRVTVTTIMMPKDESEKEKALLAVSEAARVAEETGTVGSVLSSSDDALSEANGEQVHEAVKKKSSRFSHLRSKIGAGIKNAVSGIINKARNIARIAVEEPKKLGADSWAIVTTRLYVNASLLATFIHSGLIENVIVPYGSQLMLPGTEFGLIGTGAAWMGGIALGLISAGLATYVVPFSEWMTVEYKLLKNLCKWSFDHIPLLRRLVKKLSGFGIDEEAISRDATMLTKWTLLELVFYGVPMLLLASLGYSIGATPMLFLLAVLGVSVSGVMTQFPWDSGIALKLELDKLLHPENAKRAEGIARINSTVISILANIVSVALLGKSIMISEVVAGFPNLADSYMAQYLLNEIAQAIANSPVGTWNLKAINVGAMLVTGLLFRTIASKKLYDYKKAHGLLKEQNPCANALTKSLSMDSSFSTANDDGYDKAG